MNSSDQMTNEMFVFLLKKTKIKKNICRFHLSKEILFEFEKNRLSKSITKDCSVYTTREKENVLIEYDGERLSR